DPVHLADGRVDLRNAVALFLAGRGDLVHEVADLGNAVEQFLHGGSGGIRQLAPGIDLFRGLRDEVADFARGRGRALGQAAHFRGDHGETLASFTRPSRLHGGVQGQNVRLEGNAVDDPHDIANVGRSLADGR